MFRIFVLLLIGVIMCDSSFASAASLLLFFALLLCRGAQDSFFYLRVQAIPSTSQASQLVPSMQLRNHPFYQLPRGAAGEQFLTFDGNAAFSVPGEPTRLGEALRSLRTLFLKEKLSRDEMDLLMAKAHLLLRFAAQWSPAEFELSTPYYAVNPAACRFLVVEALWSICSVVGPAMNPAGWWDRLMEHAAIPESLLSYPLSVAPDADWRPFLAKVRDALEDFRQRRRPPPDVTVALKRMIFCNPRFHRRFRTRLWDPWRTDDEEYKRKTGES